jgi:hypothetical protein
MGLLHEAGPLQTAAAAFRGALRIAAETASLLLALTLRGVLLAARSSTSAVVARSPAPSRFSGALLVSLFCLLIEASLSQWGANCMCGYYLIYDYNRDFYRCITCPQNNYCPCDDFYYSCPFCTSSSDGAADCSRPNCGAGQALNTGSCSCYTCSAGTYSSDYSTSCSICSSGKYSDVGWSDCKCCSNGRYSSSGSSGCSSCPSGQTSSSCSGTCYTLSCPAGQYKYDSSTCLSCPSGTYSSPGSTVCSSCNVGSYSSSGASSCASCPAGKYNPGTNAAACLLCAVGKFSTGGAASCFNCPEGTFSGSGGGTSCTSCAGGTFSSTSASTCSTCTAGYFCPGTTTVVSDFAYEGFTLSLSCASVLSSVVSATYGTLGCGYSGTASSVVQGQCMGLSSCSITASNSVFGDPCFGARKELAVSLACGYAISQCPAGSFCPPSSMAPSACAAGTWSAAAAATCTTCVAGKYSPGGASSCADCAAGTYNPNTGSTSSAVCVSCGPGYYCPAGSTSTTPCAAGRYGSSTGNTASSCDGPCAAGRYGSSTGNTASTCDGACSAGHYCRAGSTSATQNACPAGKYGSTTGLQTSACSGDCAAGRYGSSTGNIASTCNGPCAAGRYGSSTGNTASTCDDPCAAGRYGSSTGNNASTCDGPCSAGFYCPAGSTSATQLPCAAGRYGSSTGNTASSCDGPCSAGFYCPAGSTSATQNACPAGSFCPLSSSAPSPCTGWTLGALPAQAFCGACPPNHFCTGQSASPCVPDGRCAMAGCASGYTGALCGDCAPGHYMYSPPLSGSTACGACPSNFTVVVTAVLAGLSVPVLLVVLSLLAIFQPRCQCLCCCSSNPEASRLNWQVRLKHLTADSFIGFTIRCHVGFLVLLNNVTAIPFPESLRQYLLQFVGYALGMNANVVHPECAVPWSVLHTWCVVASAFIIFWVASLLTTCCARAAGQEPDSPLSQATKAPIDEQPQWGLSVAKLSAQNAFQLSLKVAAFTTVDGTMYLSYKMSLRWWADSGMGVDHRPIFVFSIVTMVLAVWLTVVSPFLLARRVYRRRRLALHQNIQGVGAAKLLGMVDVVHNFLQFGSAFAILYGPNDSYRASIHLLAFAAAELLSAVLFYFCYKVYGDQEQRDFGLYVGLQFVTCATVVLGVVCTVNVKANNEAVGWGFFVANVLFLGVSVTWGGFKIHQAWTEALPGHSFRCCPTCRRAPLLGTHAGAPPPPPPLPPPPPASALNIRTQQWECSACTFLNSDALATNCSLCATSR